MYYFAYGSNMDEQELTSYIEGKGGDPAGVCNPRWARLGGWRLVFNYFSPSRGAGAANIERAEGQWVEGVLWDATEEAGEHIDKKEGYPRYYERICVEVCDRQGRRYRQVLTYQVVEQRRLVGHCPPKRGYLHKMTRAATRFGFSQEYRQVLNAIDTTDPGNRGE